MRLLHSETLEFKEFNSDNVPPYAILSHTWGVDEVNYQEMRFLENIQALPESLRTNEAVVAALGVAADLNYHKADPQKIRHKRGFNKITKTAAIARAKELPYFWIDTCCIDKSSSAELQEAINSMYRWYQRSTSCIIRLEDCTKEWPAIDWEGYRLSDSVLSSLRCIKWFTRGWTLQELIAPKQADFYDRDWDHICDKFAAVNVLREITEIPQDVLTTGDLGRASVAQKMSWASGRKTTYIEDNAYALMGLFEVHMLMLYGEGEKAF
jgi:hypothetical protein